MPKTDSTLRQGKKHRAHTHIVTSTHSHTYTQNKRKMHKRQHNHVIYFQCPIELQIGKYFPYFMCGIIVCNFFFI